MNENFSEELKKELVKQAVKSLEDPFKMLTVKDVAKDLYMGENKTNEIFNRADFPSVNIGKTRKIQKIAYILWKMEKRIDVIWKKLKSIYTKVHFGEQTFAQMPHKDISNLYKNSISFFLIFNNRETSIITRKWEKNGKSKKILLDKAKNRFL